MEVICLQPLTSLPVHKIRGAKSKAHILEQITSLGYEEHNKILVESGFDKVRRNLKLLMKNNGDLDTVLNILNEKLAKKALRLQKKKEKELAGGERIKKTKIRSRSEKPLRKTRRAHKIADNIVPEDEIALKLEDLAKTEERKDKKEMKARRERRGISEMPEKRAKSKRERSPREKNSFKYEEWPSSGVTRVFLDGNNLLYADNHPDNFLFKLQLRRKQRQAEEALSKLASMFAARIGSFHTTLVFDRIKIPTSNSTVLSNEGGKPLEFEICCARPKYPTADDALVDWMGNQSNPGECLVVTSDRALKERLREKGVTHLMKTTNWFKIVQSVLGEEYNKIAAEYTVAGKEGEENEAGFERGFRRHRH